MMTARLNKSEILERLRKLVSERTDVDVRQMSLAASLADLGIDSFTLIEIVFAAEEEFGVSIKLDDVRIERVQDVVQAIEDNLAPAGA
jgi:acyl carrier protein